MENMNIDLNYEIEMIFNFENEHDKITFQAFYFKLFVT